MGKRASKARSKRKKCGLSVKWNEPVVNRTLLATTKKQVNTFSAIARPKVPKTAEVCVTTVKDWV